MSSLSLSQILKNILVLVVLLVVYALLIVSCVYGRYLDRLDEQLLLKVSLAPDTDEAMVPPEDMKSKAAQRLRLFFLLS